MRSFRLDPYLWVHLAGLAAVPLWLDICLLGLATGEPVLPTWVELGMIGGIGILPIVWMQWQKPFSIFSLVLLALRPDRMGEDRRRILRLFKDPLVKFLAALAPIPLIWVLVRLYTLAPLASDLTPFAVGGRGLGLLVAAIAFLLVNLFVQVPVSVLRVLATPQRVFNKLPPYPSEQVKQDFTVLGFRVNRILPDWQASAKPAVVKTDSVASVSPPQPVATTLEEDLDTWGTNAEDFSAMSEVTSDLSTDDIGSAEIVSTELSAPMVPATSEPVAPEVESLASPEIVFSEELQQEAATSEAEALITGEPVSDEDPDFAKPLADLLTAASETPWQHPEPDLEPLEPAFEPEVDAAEPVFLDDPEINPDPSGSTPTTDASDSSESSWHA
ncbi:low-complexity tail membrane protein [Pseudanabaena sp. FACHB-2040]|uniref:low-complexity tail membrane protein n=1 Tax=Pseudanabaena sp. FACHB-2040 TaxID=2692859 RepID=UPI0016862B5A|nr:low-complexity tail membrane protein [Pseudanabaena sp. FACHB-2040]MBD2260820.1 low-complexity tail membrane protein [Pseudanabaena sp. FACHB-2040]